MKRAALLYIFILVAAGLPILWLLHAGSALPAPTGAPAIQPAAMPAALVGSTSALTAMWTGLAKNFSDPLSHLFLQLLAIITASRAMGWIFTRFGQPAVVGEMAAGILLGPSLFGLLAPGSFAFVFPPASLGALKLLSEVGVCLFMFAVGMELNMGLVRHRAHTALVVSHAGIVFPYLLGVGLAYVIYSHLAAPGASFTAFALFMGISMSVTAFPVLARILQERNLTRTFLGSTAITCAAIGDVTAWTILAFIVAITRSSSLVGCALNLVLIVAFIAFMVGAVKPALPHWLGESRLTRDEPSRGTLAAAMCVTVGAALCTEAIGIHALFGAFLAGAIMPDTDGFRHKLGVRIENFSSVLLLPLFFAFTGLRTQVGLLNDWQGWLICLAIIAVATLGKLGGSAITARLTGMTWTDSLQLGALMNTRGLMELIVLNMGYDLGILSPRIFTMLVIMALATTVLTGPLLTLFGERQTSLADLPLPSRS
jgi:Kef-type K+ transport system membrane component KefB